MLSHADDGALESCWRQRCQVLLVTALSSPTLKTPSRAGDDAAGETWPLKMLSHAGDDVVGVTWPRHDVDTELCW
jgi:hypothetical protein